MVDLHAHILPGVDDGPSEWDKALKMLSRAAQDGITDIVATPHVVPGGYDITRDRVTRLTDELRERSAEPGIKIYPGSELLICPDTLMGLERNVYCTLNFTRYVLLELPAQPQPNYVLDFLAAVVGLGLVPIVAHPERHELVYGEGLETVYEMVRAGALMQITAGSITGVFGNAVKKAASEMLEKRLVHVIGSDAHSIGKRPPVLSKGLAAAARLIGERAARAMVLDVPRAILDNMEFDVQEPLYKKKRLALFR